MILYGILVFEKRSRWLWYCDWYIRCFKIKCKWGLWKAAVDSGASLHHSLHLYILLWITILLLLHFVHHIQLINSAIHQTSTYINPVDNWGCCTAVLPRPLDSASPPRNSTNSCTSSCYSHLLLFHPSRIPTLFVLFQTQLSRPRPQRSRKRPEQSWCFKLVDVVLNAWFWLPKLLLDQLSCRRCLRCPLW